MTKAEIVVPPLDEQRRIVDFLDTETVRIDALITNRLRQLELLAAREAAALTPQRDLSSDRISVWQTCRRIALSSPLSRRSG